MSATEPKFVQSNDMRIVGYVNITARKIKKPRVHTRDCYNLEIPLLRISVRQLRYAGIKKGDRMAITAPRDGTLVLTRVP